MEYQIIPVGDLWSEGMFSVPKAVTEKYLRFASELQLKALLIILSSSGVAGSAEISKKLGITQQDTESLMEYWVSEGVVSQGGGSSAAVSAPKEKKEEEKPAPKKPAEKRRTAKISVTAPVLTPKDIVSLADENPEIEELLQEAQKAYGRTISHSEEEMIVNLVTFYGLSFGAVLLLLGYCRREREAGKAISAAYFYKIAEKWLDDGVSTVEDAEAKLRELEKSDRLWQRIRERAEISKKMPTVAQREMILNWKKDFSTEMIELAIDEMKENIDNPNLRYVNKILKNWKRDGINTPEEYRKSQEEYKQKKDGAISSESGKISRTPTYDLKGKRKKDLNNTDIKY